MGLEMKYFVLNPRGKHRNDPWAIASREAMITFARFIEKEDPDLCNALLFWVEREDIKQGELPK